MLVAGKSAAAAVWGSTPEVERAWVEWVWAEQVWVPAEWVWRLAAAQVLLHSGSHFSRGII